MAILSMGRLADVVARAVGWSPVGRTVVITGAEGPFAELINGTLGTVRSIENGAMLIEVDRPGTSGLRQGAQLRLRPHHLGWTPFSLLFQRIAVVVEAVEPDGSVRQTSIAIVALVRSKPRVSSM